MVPQDAWPQGAGWPQTTAAPARRRAGRIVFWILTGLAAAVLVGGFASAFASVQALTDPATSMEPTIPAGSRLLAERGSAVRRGDLVIFSLPAAVGPPGLVAVKRLIGLPGDHVACCDSRGRVTVNGKPLDETYLYPGDSPSADPFSVVLRKNQAWVLGDRRTVSYDSRGYGPVRLSSVIGRVVLIARKGSFFFTPVRTPHTFVADGLAPPDRRAPWPAALAVASAGLCALAALTVFGLVRLVVRPRAGRQPA